MYTDFKVPARALVLRGEGAPSRHPSATMGAWPV